MNFIKNKAFRIFLYVFGYITAAAVIVFSVITAARYTLFSNDIGSAEDFAVTTSMRSLVSNALNNLQAEAKAASDWEAAGLEKAVLNLAEYPSGEAQAVPLEELAKDAGFSDVRQALLSERLRMDADTYSSSGSYYDGDYDVYPMQNAAVSNPVEKDPTVLKIRKDDYVNLFTEHSTLYSDEQMIHFQELEESFPSASDSAAVRELHEDYADYRTLNEKNYTELLYEGVYFRLTEDGILLFYPDSMNLICYDQNRMPVYQYSFNDYSSASLYVVLPGELKLTADTFEKVSDETAAAVFSGTVFDSPLDIFYASLDPKQQDIIRSLRDYSADQYGSWNMAYSFGKDEISGSDIENYQILSDYAGTSEMPDSYSELAEQILVHSDIYVRYDKDSGALTQWYKDPAGNRHDYAYVVDIRKLTESVDEDFTFGLNLYKNHTSFYLVDSLLFAVCNAIPSPVLYLIVSAVVFLLCVILLLVGVPSRLLAIDKVPFEIFLAVDLLAMAGLAWLMSEGDAGRSIAQLAEQDPKAAIAIVLLFILGFYILAAGLLTTIVRRCKCRSFADGLLIIKLAKLLARGIRFLSKKTGNAFESISRTYEHALSGHKRLILFISVLFFVNAIFLVFFGLMFEGTVIVSLILVAAEAFAGYHLLKYSAGANRVLAVSRQIEAGDLSAKTDPAELKYNIKELGESLNRLGDGLSMAVESSVRDERTKAELITNVSHDIKTPLTSIISYVDLLKKENIENERAQEYIRVLDQKSQRLKQLIADLIEVSKTNTGNIELERTNLDLAELLDQAVGEYEEKMHAAGLEPVLNINAANTVIYADGRRIFRIIDNLFNNATKYAQPGTRVYIDLVNPESNSGPEVSSPNPSGAPKVREPENAGRKKVALRVKNISREMLNISAKELTERFVRGDRARHSEGSGLGLSIAKNLTELQDGSFDVRIDGDLFTVEVVFPTVSR